jgi:hypothetical protein
MACVYRRRRLDSIRRTIKARWDGWRIGNINAHRCFFLVVESRPVKLDAQSRHARAFLRSYPISSAGVVPISGVRAFLPGPRTPFRMQQGNNQHAIGADLVQHSVREAPDNASPRSARE